MKLSVIYVIRAIFFGLALTLFSAFSYADSPTYTFAVIPQFKPAQLQKEWNPILERITRETGVKLKLSIPTNTPKFEADLSNGSPDFAFMNPYQTILANKENGYIPLLRDKKPLNGIIVVRKDSPYKKVSDLNGQVIGFPSPNAFGASLVIRAKLTEENPIKFTPKILNNHTLVLKHVLLGHVAAGGTVNSALNDAEPEVRNQMVVLYTTPDFAPHPITVHPRVPDQIRKSVTNALINMQQDVEGRAMLKEIRMPNLTDANFKNDYQSLEKLNLQKYILEED